MADPYGNYVAGLGFLSGPELNPGALSPEQLSVLKSITQMPVPGAPFRAGIAADRLGEGAGLGALLEQIKSGGRQLQQPMNAEQAMRAMRRQMTLQGLPRRGLEEWQTPLTEWTTEPRNYPFHQVNPYPDANYVLPELTLDDVRGRWRGPYTDI